MNAESRGTGTSNRLKLTVGLPVYNGENYLADALQAILTQSFTDFQLVVSDNASTDATESIIRQMTKDDPRVVYLRQPVNLGAAPNYNITFETSEPSDYFVWISHDDVPHERYFEACVKALDADPAAVVAFSTTRRIGTEGEEILILPPRTRLTSPVVSDRFAEAIRQDTSPHPFFGVMRKTVLARTHLHGSYLGSDRALLAEMAVQGRYIEIPETLFDIRWHHQKSTAQPFTRDTKTKRYTRDVWFDSSNEGKIRLPRWIRFGAYSRAVTTAPVSASEKVQSFGELARWLGVWGNSKALIYEIMIAGRTLVGRVLSRRR